jgi:hypothetical protein
MSKREDPPYVDLFTECARDRLGEKPEWKLYLYEVKDSPHGEYYELTGAIAPPVTKGPRKGLPNWRKMDKATVKTVQLTIKEYEQYAADWEKRTGSCRDCFGSGKRFVGWSAETGNRFQPCDRCDRGKQPQTENVDGQLALEVR